MKKTLGRLAGAVLAGALISLAVTPTANAEGETSSSTSAAATTTAPPASETATATQTAPPTSQSTSDTKTSAPETTTAQPGQTSTSGKPTETGKPTTTTRSSETSAPQEPPYEDDTAYGVDLDGGLGVVMIACAAGEPTGLRSKDFDLVEGPHQDETDGRYWLWLVKRHEGVSFEAGGVYADWTCAGKPSTGEHVPPAGGAGSGSAGTTGGHGDSQVKYTPKRGVETGFGGMAA
ncbi:hypothetical protein [Amycolatopsis jejuensis]|uniref:hypothetical protein n=1 Tax=Amycolatopsis jejuensis TaxID=330084 RepID=UPI0007C5762A|nr:hypothetical protein [Amycolatopsis jejuensis]